MKINTVNTANKIHSYNFITSKQVAFGAGSKYTQKVVSSAIKDTFDKVQDVKTFNQFASLFNLKMIDSLKKLGVKVKKVASVKKLKDGSRDLFNQNGSKLANINIGEKTVLVKLYKNNALVEEIKTDTHARPKTRIFYDKKTGHKYREEGYHTRSINYIEEYDRITGEHLKSIDFVDGRKRTWDAQKHEFYESRGGIITKLKVFYNTLLEKYWY